jgi:hypothetical protein
MSFGRRSASSNISLNESQSSLNRSSASDSVELDMSVNVSHSISATQSKESSSMSKKRRLSGMSLSDLSQSTRANGDGDIESVGSARKSTSLQLKVDKMFNTKVLI